MGKFAIMHRVVRKGNLKLLKRLIKSGMSVDSRDDKGRTPLHVAAEQNQYEVAEFLISYKCDLNLQDNSGYTHLLRAAFFENRGVVNLLLDCGAKVTCANFCKWNLLHQASFYGWVDTVKRIVESGEADLNAATGLGWTTLMIVVGDGSEEMATLLIRAGADVNHRDIDNSTALHWAACIGQTKLAQVLLEEEGLNLNTQDDMGETPLHLSCRWGRTEVLKQLLAAGADIKMKNNHSETALTVCIKNKKNPSLEGIRIFFKPRSFFLRTVIMYTYPIIHFSERTF